MPRHRSHSTDFKRQVVAEYHAGETLHALGRRHDLSRNLIRIWIEKAEAGSLDQDMASAELLSGYETRIAALERLVGRQTLDLEFLQEAQKNGQSPRSGPASVTVGPAASPSSGGALMGLPRSTYYATPKDKPSDAELVAEIRAITDVFECYGYRLVGAELRHRGHNQPASGRGSRPWPPGAWIRNAEAILSRAGPASEKPAARRLGVRAVQLSFLVKTGCRLTS